MIKLFKFLTELFGWFQIVLFPLIVGLFIGAAVYGYKRDTVGMLCGIVIALMGLFAGIIMANRIRKKKGVIDFLSRIRATPELDGTEEKDKDN